MAQKNCKVCLNKKSLSKFIYYDDSLGNGYSDICQICTDIGLSRCLNCNDMMIYKINLFNEGLFCSKQCKNQHYENSFIVDTKTIKIIEEQKEKKCRICKNLKTIDNFDLKRVGGDPDYERCDNYIPKDHCKECNGKDICRTCNNIKDYDRFYLFRGCPNTEKCKDCYVKGHRLKDQKKIVKKLF